VLLFNGEWESGGEVDPLIILAHNHRRINKERTKVRGGERKMRRTEDEMRKIREAYKIITKIKNENGK
jgi:hypothetical protein